MSGDITSQSKRGYLNGDFELFHLKDRKNLKFEYHYHDFYKIIVFLSGNVTYFIEGNVYSLKPWDILLIGNNEVHRPIIDPGEVYERVVIWVDTAFLEKHSNSECNLCTCFDLVSEKRANLIRLESGKLRHVHDILSQLEDACKYTGFGSRISKNSLIMQLIVLLGRELLGTSNTTNADVQFDENISSIITYINENLKAELSIDSLSTKFFTSRYYLMHKFKQYTGCSIHNYILQKRLIKANLLIKDGMSPTQASLECGFGDYSNFVRSFKKMFGLSPRNYCKSSPKAGLCRNYKEKHFSS